MFFTTQTALSAEYLLADASIQTEVSTETSNDIEYSQRSEESELILEVVYKGEPLDLGILAYLDGESVLLPLGTISELLGLPITVDTANGEVSGWLTKEEDTLSLSPPYTSYKLGGKTFDLNGKIVELHFDDLYVQQDLLYTWLKINTTLNFQELRIFLETDTVLNFEEERMRRLRWKKAGIAKKTAERKLDGPILALPYQKFIAPAIRVNHTLNSSKSGDDKISSLRTSVQAAGEAYGYGYNANGNLFQDTDGRQSVDNILLRFDKFDKTASMLGPLKATRLQFGDATTAPFPLAGGQQRGRGFNLSNEPEFFTRDPNQTQIEGFAPAGWDVEIYQDERLLDFQTTGDDGRYIFDTLPLRTGFNLFRIVTYGPSGEVRESFKRYYLGQDAVKEGQFIYNVSALESIAPLIDVSADKPPSTPHTFSVIGEYGLTKSASASMGLFQGPVGPNSLSALGAGLKMSGKSWYAQVNTLYDNESQGKSGSLDITGNISKTGTYRARYVKHEGYKPDTFSIDEEKSINFSQAFSFMGLSQSNVSLGVKQQNLATGQKLDVITNAFSFSFFGIKMSNSLEYQKNSGNQNPAFVGDLTLRRNIWRGNLRGRLQYDIENGDILNSSMQLQRQLSKKLFLNSELLHTFGDTPQTDISAGLDYRWEKVHLGFNGRVSDSGDANVGLSVEYAFVPDLEGYKIVGYTPNINNGTLLIRPYVDLNNNDQYDPNEELVEGGLLFKNMLRGTKTKTNKEGLAALSGFAPRQLNRIILDPASIPDIYLQPKHKEINVEGKLGIQGPVDYPLTLLGEMSGSLFLIQEDGSEEPLKNARIVLLNADQKVVAESYTEFDGFFVLPSLPMGEYQIYFPATDSLQEYLAQPVNGPIVTLRPNSPELSNLDFLVDHEANSISAVNTGGFNVEEGGYEEFPL